MKLDGKTAIVTGAGKNIGLATAMRLAEEGASVVVNDIDMPLAERIAGEINSSGGSALPFKADVRDSKQVKEMVEAALKTFGRIDILVNNAGGSARKQNAPFHETSEEVVSRVLDINLKGVFVCSRAVIGNMIEQKSGKIVNISSTEAFCGGYKIVDYAAAKGGVISFTRALASGAGRYNINVNCVSPGPLETEEVMPTSESREKYRRSTCLRRNGKPEEVAGLVFFLVSDEASFITGQNHVIDGGRSLNAGWDSFNIP